MNYIRSLSGDTLLYGGGKAITQLFSLMLAPILTAYFSPEQYGIISLLQMVFGVFIVLALLNISSGVFYYYYSEDSSQEVISTSLIFHLLVAFVVSVLVFMLSETLATMLGISGIVQESSLCIEILSLGLFFTVLNNEFKNVLRMKRKAQRFFFLIVFEIVILFLSTVIFVVFYSKGVEYVFISNLISGVLAFSLGLFFVYKYYSLSFSVNYIYCFFAYSLPQFPGVFFNWGLSESNKIVLSNYSDFTELGFYSLGVKISSFFLLFSMAFRMAWDPFALSIMKRVDAKNIYRQCFEFYCISFITISAFVYLVGKPVLLLFFSEEYLVSYDVVIYYVFGLFFQGLGSFMSIGINIVKKTYLLSVVQFISFSSVVILSVSLVPVYGAVGASISFLLASVMQAVIFYYCSEKVFLVEYNFKSCVFMAGVVFLFAIVFGYFAQSVDTLAGSIILFLLGFVGLLSLVVFVSRLCFKNSYMIAIEKIRALKVNFGQ